MSYPRVDQCKIVIGRAETANHGEMLIKIACYTHCKDMMQSVCFQCNNYNQIIRMVIRGCGPNWAGVGVMKTGEFFWWISLYTTTIIDNIPFFSTNSSLWKTAYKCGCHLRNGAANITDSLAFDDVVYKHRISPSCNNIVIQPWWLPTKLNKWK